MGTQTFKNIYLN